MVERSRAAGWWSVVTVHGSALDKACSLADMAIFLQPMRAGANEMTERGCFVKCMHKHIKQDSELDDMRCHEGIDAMRKCCLIGNCVLAVGLRERSRAGNAASFVARSCL